MDDKNFYIKANILNNSKNGDKSKNLEDFSLFKNIPDNWRYG
jgi:hypothetical protein